MGHNNLQGVLDVGLCCHAVISPSWPAEVVPEDCLCSEQMHKYSQGRAFPARGVFNVKSWL